MLVCVWFLCVLSVPVVVVLPVVVVVVVVPVVFVGGCVLPGGSMLSRTVELPVVLCCVVRLFFVSVLAVGFVVGAGISVFTLVVPRSSAVVVVVVPGVVVVVVPVAVVVRVVSRYVVVRAPAGVGVVAKVGFCARP